MQQLILPLEEQNLFEELTSIFLLEKAFKAVRKNAGSPGIDGMSVQEFWRNRHEELGQLSEELTSWTYKPKPVKQVEIAKASGGIRKLGIPCVRDRVVQTGLKLLLEPILEQVFSAHSYGFRPRRSQREAVEAGKEIVSSGKSYVVDIDLSDFFDRINHDRLISRLSSIVPDKRIRRLIGLTLRSGIMRNGVFNRTSAGAPQGSPLSPLLSNFVLDELDKELEQRGLPFCRYADDCNIYVSSLKAAERVMLKISDYIERRLKLRVNRGKSQVGKSNMVKFLGMTILEGTVAISKQSMSRAMERVKHLTPRGTSQKIEQAMEQINQWYVGWSNYFSMTNYPSQLAKIEAHIRRRLRARLVSQQKSRRNLYNKLIKRGATSKSSNKAVYYSHKKRWALSRTPAVHKAYPNSWFEESIGQQISSQRGLGHWFSLDKWVKLA